ncbi:substrate-binding domain-containing protein [Mesorhizobium sp. M0701]|uniref:sugar ABC transporter substrate-binding protein n=1 Tax=Mesorhizobium sp. M0701 TaxID=2956989 RepID=UPI00333610B0
MTNKDELSGLSRRTFGKMIGLAGSAAMLGLAGGVEQAAAAPDDWKQWINSTHDKPIKMAVSCYNTTNPYYRPTQVGALDAGDQLGIQVDWTGVPDGNTVAQIAQFQQLVGSGYQAIVVIPLEADAWIAPIEKATAAGVIVLTANSDSPNSGRELFFGQDLVGAAVVQGELIAKLAGGKGDVALTNCAPGLLALDQRIQGAKQGATKGGLNVVNVYNTNPSDMASELATIKDILKANPNLAAIMPLCGPDTAAAGLVRKEMNLKHPIVGCDLMYQTLELIKSGHIDATIGQQPYMQGYMPITYAYQRAILGAPKLALPGGNYFMANEIVTKDNVDSFLVREKRFQG